MITRCRYITIWTILLSFLLTATTSFAAVLCRDVFIKTRQSSDFKTILPEELAVLRDTFDFNRQWGTKLLLDSDLVWSDPVYLKRLHEFAKPAITNYADGKLNQTDKNGTPTHFAEPTEAGKLRVEYESYLSSFAQGEVLSYTITGTAANNLLYEYAAKYYHYRTSKHANHVQLLHFKDMYGGSHGRIVDTTIHGPEELLLPTPWVRPNSVLNKYDLENVIAIEQSALDTIINRVKDPTLEIGGIFIELAQIHRGVQVYRPEFLQKLRELADNLKVPIFVDEIMSGGGRTGKFWSYQNYPGFIPDVLTFGKGLIVAGTFAPKRDNGPWQSLNTIVTSSVRTTTAVQPLVLLQAMQVLKAIKERNLIENAKNAGDYFLFRLKEKIYHLSKRSNYSQFYIPPELSNLGLMIHYTGPYKKLGFWYRLLPPLTLTKEQIDYVIDNWDEATWAQ